jgi:hypothetical protein
MVKGFIERLDWLRAADFCHRVGYRAGLFVDGLLEVLSERA